MSITHSRHSLFIRGFTSDIKAAAIRDFFKTEGYECRIESYKVFNDQQSSIILRFRSNHDARDVIQRYSDTAILGKHIVITWNKEYGRPKYSDEEDDDSFLSKHSLSPNHRPSHYSLQSKYAQNTRLLKLRQATMKSRGNYGIRTGRKRRSKSRSRSLSPRRRRDTSLSPAHNGRSSHEESGSKGLSPGQRESVRDNHHSPDVAQRHSSSMSPRKHYSEHSKSIEREFHYSNSPDNDYRGQKLSPGRHRSARSYERSPLLSPHRKIESERHRGVSESDLGIASPSPSRSRSHESHERSLSQEHEFSTSSGTFSPALLTDNGDAPKINLTLKTKCNLQKTNVFGGDVDRSEVPVGTMNSKTGKMTWETNLDDDVMQKLHKIRMDTQSNAVKHNTDSVSRSEGELTPDHEHNADSQQKRNTKERIDQTDARHVTVGHSGQNATEDSENISVVIDNQPVQSRSGQIKSDINNAGSAKMSDQRIVEESSRRERKRRRLSNEHGHINDDGYQHYTKDVDYRVGWSHTVSAAESPDESTSKKPRHSRNTALIQPETAEQDGRIGNTGEVVMTLTPEKISLIKTKKAEVERAYRQDCETFSTVVKMLVSKDPSLESKIQNSLRENMKDIGKRCIAELRKYISDLKRSDDAADQVAQ